VGEEGWWDRCRTVQQYRCCCYCQRVKDTGSRVHSTLQEDFA